ncbi:MAG: B12-binding domain-containing radical SAM protein [Desulfobacteraceae bacterium]|nr:B12-binding domain-containing radical SAM protein [Desulfobacteraceae bacterium]
MRVLLLNPALPFGTWTFRQVCNALGAKSLVAPLGLVTIAAMLPAEWDARFIDLNSRRPTEQEWQWADLVMISGMLMQRENTRNLVREAKDRGKIVAAGGPYATSLPDEILEAGADFLVRGEAEETISRLVASLRAGTPGAVFEESGKPDITKSPVPRFDLLRFEDYAMIPIQTSRGCPFDCEFCDVVNLNGRTPRHKNPDQVIRELEAIYNHGWRSQVFICDDNFVGNKQHARAVLQKLIPWMKSHGEPFVFATQASVNLGQDKELMDLMTEANFNHILVGVESPDEDVLTRTNKHQNVRNPLVESLRNMNRNGLIVWASFIIGFDNEKSGAGRRICEFVEAVGIPVPTVNTLRILPHTKLWKRLEAEGRLIEDKGDANMIGGPLNYVPARPQSEILAEYLATIDRLYEPAGYLARTFRYFLSMRPTRAALGRAGGGGDSKHARSSRNAPRLSSTLRFLWRQGVRSEHRVQFWRQLVRMHRENPSRMISYLDSCALGENLFSFRERIPAWATGRRRPPAPREDPEKSS